jgi:transcription initiation factor TFIIH subunit 2
MNKFTDFEGNASLQNSLELSMENLVAVPSYAKKEILVVFSSITNCDPGNIFESINKLATKKIECSVISLSAAIHVLQ